MGAIFESHIAGCCSEAILESHLGATYVGYTWEP